MKKNLTIGIFGFGRFGTLCAAVLSRNFEVRVFNYRNLKDNHKKAKKLGVELADLNKTAESDIVLLAVPISKTKEMIKKVAPKMKKGSLLLDTCSVKKLPCTWLKKYSPKGVHAMGTHPMFGPVTTKFNLKEKTWDLKNKQIILCPVKGTKNLNPIKQYLKKLGLEVIVVSPEEHDKQNAKTLSFVHFLGRSLTQAKIGPQRIFTPGYADVLKILPHTNQDDWQLFYDMNNFNPYAEKTRNDFLDSCSLIEKRIIKSNSSGSFSYQRNLINKIDKEIFSLLKKRLECANKIGAIKKKKGINIKDKKREEVLIKKQQEESDLPKDFVKKLYKLLFNESYKQQ